MLYMIMLIRLSLYKVFCDQALYASYRSGSYGIKSPADRDPMLHTIMLMRLLLVKYLLLIKNSVMLSR